MRDYGTPYYYSIFSKFLPVLLVFQGDAAAEEKFMTINEAYEVLKGKCTQTKLLV